MLAHGRGYVFQLTPVETELEAIPIVENADKATEAGIFLEQLRSLEIGELYSQELVMKRSIDFYVPNVLRRLPGVSLLSGRYISLRGLGERYNAFAFWATSPAWLSYDASFGEIEQLITTLLGKVEVRKFWTPELLGHFGGGMVDFQLPAPSQSALQVAFTSEGDAGAVGRPFPAFRRPYRTPIPEDFPAPRDVIASENAGLPLPENFSYGQRVQRYTVPDTLGWAPPGGLLTLAFDKISQRWQVALRAAYSRRYLSSTIKFEDGTFEKVDGEWRYVPTLSDVGHTPVYLYSEGGGVSGSVSIQLSPQHSFLLEGISLLNSFQRNVLEASYYINPDIDSTQQVYSYYPNFLTQRSYLHILRPSWSWRNTQGWQARVQMGSVWQGQAIPQAGAMNYVRYPGTTDLVYEQELYDESEIYAQVWTSQTQAHQLYVHPFIEKQWGKEKRWVQLRVGGWYSQEVQRSSARQLGFMTDTAGGGPYVLDPAVYDISHIRDVYAPAHVRPGGWYLIERTGDFHRHRGLTEMQAGYAWLRGATGRWEALFGVRYEAWRRTLWHIPIATETETLAARFRDAHWLPACLIKYWLGEGHTLRLGANMTLIRPPFPAQVPLPYFDYMWAYYWTGDLGVHTGRSYNADLRYEWLKDKENLLAVSTFYKRLYELPEVYLIPASFNLVFTYSTRVRRWGEVIGAELEYRRLWWDTDKGRLWSTLTLAISESGLERSPLTKLGRLEGRLQGHSPLVGNLGCIYTHKRWEAATFLNYTASQIWAVGFDPYIYPHIVEQSRWMGEAQVTYRFSERWELRAAVLDFLNQPYRRTQRVGNANTFDPDRDAMPVWERWAYRFYLTLRYRVGL